MRGAVYCVHKTVETFSFITDRISNESCHCHKGYYISMLCMYMENEHYVNTHPLEYCQYTDFVRN